MYNIYSAVTNQTLQLGLINCLDTLRRQNPGWQYRFSENDDIHMHLRILDFTAYELPEHNPSEELVLTREVNPFQTLILLSSRQCMLARQLLQSCCCSLLCVDERQIHFREIIECSLYNKRYISPLFCGLQKAAGRVTFTKAESRVLAALKEGCSGVEMAQKFHRSQKTISSHKRRIMHKLGVTNDVGLFRVLNGG